MKRLGGLVAVIALAMTACGGSGSGTRVALVDVNHDEFATLVARYFPSSISVTQGQTLEFHQNWTGEPHTITGGAGVTAILAKTRPMLNLFEAYGRLQNAGADVVNPDDPGDARWPEFVAKLRKAKPADASRAAMAAFNELHAAGVDLPSVDNPPDMPVTDALKTINDLAEHAFDGLLFVDHGAGTTPQQNVTQPCYLQAAALPAVTEEACTKAQQVQPPFDGRQGYYNSGILRYEGAQGNSYKMKIAADAKPGTYMFYCAVHGPLQNIAVDIKPKGAKVPSQAEVSRAARVEIDDYLAPMQKTFATARDKGTVTTNRSTIKGPFAGLPSNGGEGTAIDEFVPKRLTVKAGQPITWRLFGEHTIAFHVPKYLPIIDFAKPPIRTNPKVTDPAGGAATVPDQSDNGNGSGSGGNPQPQQFDGGTYSGNGFWSTGLVGADPYLEYTLRIAKPGTYDFACLVHPRMVGKIVVTAA